MSHTRRRPDPSDPFPLIVWDEESGEESVGTAVAEVDEAAPFEEVEPAAAVEVRATEPAPKPKRESKKQKKGKKKDREIAPLPKLPQPVVTHVRFWLRATLALGGAAVAATLVAAIWLWKRPEVAVPPQEVSFAAPALAGSIEQIEKSLTKAPVEAPSAPASLAYGFQAGDVLTYNFEFVQNMTVGLSAAFIENAECRGGKVSASPVRDVHLGWRLGGRADLAVYESKDRIVVGWRFSSMTLDLRGDAADAVAAGAEGGKATLEGLRGDLNREVLVTMSRSGEIAGVAFPAKTSAWVQALLSAVVLTARVTLPESPAPSWTATEADATGKYVAKYAAEGGFAMAEGKVTRITRTKADYGQLASHGAALAADAAHTTQEGGAVVLWDAESGRFRTFRVDEKLKIEGVEFAQTVTSSTAGGMRLASAARDENLATNGAAMAKAWREGSESMKPGSADIAARLAGEAEAARVRGLTGGLTIEEVLAKLESLASADTLDSPETMDLLDKLAAILKTNDAAVAVALEVVLQGTAHPAVRVALTDALGAAETTRSLEALLAIAKDTSLDPDIRGNAFSGLAMADAPPACAEAVARAAAAFGSDPAAEPALLAFGMLARKADAGRADELADTLRTLGRASSDPDWQGNYLEALGNAGLPGTLPEVEKFLGRDDVHTRARATFALRFVNSSRADSLLASARADASPAVRFAAAQALAFRPGDAARSMLEDSMKDTDPQVRAVAEEALKRR